MNKETKVGVVVLVCILSVGTFAIIYTISLPDADTAILENTGEMPKVHNGTVVQETPISLNVDFDETMFYFIDNNEITLDFDVTFDIFSSGHYFYFSLNPDIDFLNLSTNTETIEKYFLNILVRSGAHYYLFKNDEYHTDEYGTYPAGKDCDGCIYSNKMDFELKDIDEFLVDKTFTIYWHESKSDMYVEHTTFTFRFLNLEKIRLLMWDIPVGYTISVDRNLLIADWDIVSEEHTNEWYHVPSILKHDTDPWRDYPVELWYNPTTYGTVIKRVEEK